MQVTGMLMKLAYSIKLPPYVEMNQKHPKAQLTTVQYSIKQGVELIGDCLKVVWKRRPSVLLTTINDCNGQI